jgi:tRNA G26 N,N-dimethylase Trm1
MWIAPIHSKEFAAKLAQSVNANEWSQFGTFDRIKGMVAVINEVIIA